MNWYFCQMRKILKCTKLIYALGCKQLSLKYSNTSAKLRCQVFQNHFVWVFAFFLFWDEDGIMLKMTTKYMFTVGLFTNENNSFSQAKTIFFQASTLLHNNLRGALSRTLLLVTPIQHSLPYNCAQWRHHLHRRSSILKTGGWIFKPELTAHMI